MKPDELRSRLHGVQVVLVTPMKEDLEVDLDGLAANVHTILEHGVDGLVVSGTYGEFPTLASDERVEMFRTVAATAAGRVPVIACVAHSSTREVVSLAERAVDAGADGILVAPPFLSEAGPDEVVDHFRAAADAVDVGVAIYNDPDLGTYLDTALLARIADEVEGVCATKHGATDIRELTRLVETLGRPARDHLRLRHDGDSGPRPRHARHHVEPYRRVSGAGSKDMEAPRSGRCRRSPPAARRMARVPKESRPEWGSPPR